MSSKVFASVKAYSKGGRLLEKSELQALAESRDLDELVTRIKNTVYVTAISEFEHAFEMAIFNKAKNTFTRMFSSATSIGIAKLTAFEVRNIGSIAYAVEQKIPVQTTMSKLIVDQ